MRTEKGRECKRDKGIREWKQGKGICEQKG